MSLSSVTLSNIFDCVKIYDRLSLDDRQAVLNAHENFHFAYFALKGKYIEELENCREVIIQTINQSCGTTMTAEQKLCPILDFRRPDDCFGSPGEVVFDLKDNKYFKFGYGYLSYKESLQYTTNGGHVQSADDVEIMEPELQEDHDYEDNIVSVYRTTELSEYRPMSPDYEPYETLEETTVSENIRPENDVIEVRKLAVPLEKFDVVDKAGKRYKNIPRPKEYQREVIIKFRQDARQVILMKRRRQDVLDSFKIERMDIDANEQQTCLLFSHEEEWFIVSEDSSIFAKQSVILAKAGISEASISRFYIDGIHGLRATKQDIDVIRLLDIKRHYGEYYSNAPPITDTGGSCSGL